MQIGSTVIEKVKSDEIGSDYLADEMEYYAVFLRHFELAHELYQNEKFHREAYIMLLFAVECFLKDIYCVLRFKIIVGFNQATQTKFTKELPDPIRKKTTASLKASSYSHKVNELAQMIQKLCSNLKDDGNYNSFLSQLPPNEDWIHERYDDPMNPRRKNSKEDFNNLDQALNAIRHKCFGRFK